MGVYAASANKPTPKSLQAQTEVEANLAQLPDGKKTIDTCIQQQDFIEDGETRAPRRLKPA